MRKEVANYQDEQLKKAESYIKDLMQKADKLGQVQAGMKRFLRQSNTATIISKRQKRHNELVEAHGLDTSTEFDFDEKTIEESKGNNAV